MRDQQLWEWIIRLASEPMKADPALTRGEVVTADQLARRWCESLGFDINHEAIEIAIQVMEQWVFDGECVPAKCDHGKLRAFDECATCGHACRLKSVPVRPSTDETRERIWKALSAHPDGLTRGELARSSGAPEKSVTWAAKDWIAAGLIIETDETRRTSAGRLARVLKKISIAT